VRFFVIFFENTCKAVQNNVASSNILLTFAPMTYKATLDYMYAQLPMFHRVGSAAFKKDLTNTLALCEALGNPHQKFPTIHIAGTNGKGSTAHAMAAILQAQGYKTGLYISPHYKDFRERIKVNGAYVSKDFVRKFVEKNRPNFDIIQPSFFEMTVAMAFDYFNKEGVDIAVIEVGLGGRFDSTNIITPLVSVITNISFDHVDMLGDTLPLIAFEKAGIIKKGVPVVVGEEHSETRPVFEAKAKDMDATIVFASQNVDIQQVTSDFEYSDFNIKHNFDSLKNIKKLRANLSGDFQEKNLATVLQTVEVLNQTSKFKVSEQAVVEGLGNLKALTRFIGRWQVLQYAPTILVDSAHNEAGLKLATDQLKALKTNHLHIILGFVKDKDFSKVFPFFPQNATYYFAKANIPRGLDAAVLKEQAAHYGLKGKAYSTVKRALAAAKRKAGKDDLIYVGGSIFVVGEVI
jgi:dihydrofolate synthase / folylpolyglutamate synthase